MEHQQIIQQQIKRAVIENENLLLSLDRIKPQALASLQKFTSTINQLTVLLHQQQHLDDDTARSATKLKQKQQLLFKYLEGENTIRERCQNSSTDSELHAQVVQTAVNWFLSRASFVHATTVQEKVFQMEEKNKVNLNPSPLALNHERHLLTNQVETLTQQLHDLLANASTSVEMAWNDTNQDGKDDEEVLQFTKEVKLLCQLAATASNLDTDANSNFATISDEQSKRLSLVEQELNRQRENLQNVTRIYDWSLKNAKTEGEDKTKTNKNKNKGKVEHQKTTKTDKCVSNVALLHQVLSVLTYRAERNDERHVKTVLKPGSVRQKRNIQDSVIKLTADTANAQATVQQLLASLEKRTMRLRNEATVLSQAVLSDPVLRTTDKDNFTKMQMLIERKDQMEEKIERLVQMRPNYARRPKNTRTPAKKKKKKKKNSVKPTGGKISP